MTRTIWLASYLKSGNTWMRALFGNLLAKDDTLVGIDALVNEHASDRTRFDLVMLIDSGLLTDDEIDSLRPRACRALAQGEDRDCFSGSKAATPVRIVKTHDAYRTNSAGESLFGGSQGADGAILIVRDPRDVAPSLAHHFGWSIDDAITFMNDRDATSLANTRSQDSQLRQKFFDWSGHAASWLDQTDIPVHLLRYEDLLGNTAGILSGALAFAQLPATAEKIKRAAAFCDFTQLREQEARKGFVEAPRPGAKFFRRGQAGGWRDELSQSQVQRIESSHGRMMRRLGYELLYVSNIACVA